MGLLSELIAAVDCYCALQLKRSLELIGKEGLVVIYLFQEGFTVKEKIS